MAFKRAESFAPRQFVQHGREAAIFRAWTGWSGQIARLEPRVYCGL
jgi:hypothetical protein